MVASNELKMALGRPSVFRPCDIGRKDAAPMDPHPFRLSLFTRSEKKSSERVGFVFDVLKFDLLLRSSWMSKVQD